MPKATITPAIKSDDYEVLEKQHFAVLADATNLLDDVKKHTINARNAMNTDPVDATTLANEIVELAILNQRLGDRVADAGQLARATENHYKTVREEHKLRLVQVGEEREVEVDDGQTTRGKKTVKKFVTMAAGTADSAKMKLAQVEFDLWNASQALWEQLQYMRRSSDKTIDAIRSKLSFEKIDLKNS